MTFVQSDGIEWATAASVLQVSEMAGLAHDFGQDLSGQVEDDIHSVRLRNGRRTISGSAVPTHGTYSMVFSRVHCLKVHIPLQSRQLLPLPTVF